MSLACRILDRRDDLGAALEPFVSADVVLCTDVSSALARRPGLGCRASRHQPDRWRPRQWYLACAKRQC
jgi:hypothetical protein